jgi:hypothetical protein
MKLIPELAGGVEGAGNGTAEIYVRGTGTRATYYTDFDGDTAITNGADVVLDANGQATVYVNQYVDVIVKSSAAVTIQTFTVMDQASSTEVMSTSFTGVDYDTAASAAGNPVTLKAVLDLWLTNNGAIDWKVLFGGSAVTIQAALATIGTSFYNVKASPYSAVGNGVADDWAAIQSAITAANAAGGGIVFFPGGTYKITAALDVSPNTSLWGVGAGASIITSNAAAAVVLDIDATNAQFLSIVGLHLRHSVAATGTVLQATGSDGRTIIERCHIGSTLDEGRLVSFDSSEVFFHSCNFESNSATERMVVTTRDFQAIGCRFRLANSAFASTGAIYSDEPRLVGCDFVDAVGSTNAFAWVLMDSGVTAATIVGCRFSSSSTAGVGIALGTISVNNILSESGNVFTGNIIPYSFTQANIIPPTLNLGSRRGRRLDVTSDAAALTITPLSNDFIAITRAANTAMTVTIADAPEGTEFWLLYFAGGAASTAAVLTIAATSATVRGTAAFTPSDAADRVALFHCRKLVINSVHSWSVLAHSSQWVN